MYAIRPRLCTESVHNFVRIPYKGVNEKRPHRLPKCTPETRQIGCLERPPKPHKKGAPGRRQQDLYERLVRGPSRNEGNSPWASPGNAIPRETIRAYAMRVNGYLHLEKDVYVRSRARNDSHDVGTCPTCRWCQLSGRTRLERNKKTKKISRRAHE